MNFYITDTFQAALARLDNASQKAAKTCAFELQMDPIGDGKQFHRIDRAKEKNFWSVRASRDIRLIVHKTGDRITLCYVDHHDAAYAWAERRVFEIHPVTNALQIVELVEKVREVEPKKFPDLVDLAQSRPAMPPAPLHHVTSQQLLDHGVPPQWIEPLLAADEDQLLGFVDHLPGEAFEAVMAFALGEIPRRSIVVSSPDVEHPDEKRRFQAIDGMDELEQALNYPWDKWSVFLHPSQRDLVNAEFDGPARVSGSAGTGKTVVALHRAFRMSRTPDARVLLTTFSKPLAAALQNKVNILNGDERLLAPNIHVASWSEAACELHELQTGHKPTLVTDAQLRKHFETAAPNEDLAFLISEWRDVVDAWNLDEPGYLDMIRKGRRSRISRQERARLWPIFLKIRAAIRGSGRLTEAMLFGDVAAAYGKRSPKPFSHVVVDEAQDLGVSEIRFLAAIAPAGPNTLFFAGDLGQRIFQLPFSWSSLGVDVKGRSTTLKINYRTSHQVRTASDRLLPDAIFDVDGIGEARQGTVSIFNGPEPQVEQLDSIEAEIGCVKQWVALALRDGIPLREIGLIARSDAGLSRARQIATELNLGFQTLTESMTIKGDALPLGVMHLAKGLEFRCVAVIACDDDQLPLRSRVEAATTEADLDEVYATERQLLYVACTRARERLLVTGVKPVSDYLADLG